MLLWSLWVYVAACVALCLYEIGPSVFAYEAFYEFCHFFLRPVIFVQFMIEELFTAAKDRKRREMMNGWSLSKGEEKS